MARAYSWNSWRCGERNWEVEVSRYPASFARMLDSTGSATGLTTSSGVTVALLNTTAGSMASPLHILVHRLQLIFLCPDWLLLPSECITACIQVNMCSTYVVRLGAIWDISSKCMLLLSWSLHKRNVTLVLKLVLPVCSSLLCVFGSLELSMPQGRVLTFMSTCVTCHAIKRKCMSYIFRHDCVCNSLLLIVFLLHMAATVIWIWTMPADLQEGFLEGSEESQLLKACLTACMQSLYSVCKACVFLFCQSILQDNSCLWIMQADLLKRLMRKDQPPQRRPRQVGLHIHD